MRRSTWGLLVAVVLLGVSAAAFAQQGGGGGGRGGRGGGAFGGMMPTMGTVQVIGDNGLTLAIKPNAGPQQAQTIMVKSDANTKLWEVVDTDVATLKVGDSITLTGQPLKVQASAVQAGGNLQQMAADAMGMGAAAGGGAGGGRARRMPGGPAAMANVTSAVVSSVQPLIVDLNGLKIEVDVAKDAQVVKFQPLADLTAVKVNSKIIAMGQRNGNDVAARLLLLDSTAAGFTPMGAGGPGGAGGRGGRGGRGGGAGGAAGGAAGAAAPAAAAPAAAPPAAAN